MDKLSQSGRTVDIVQLVSEIPAEIEEPPEQSTGFFDRFLAPPKRVRRASSPARLSSSDRTERILEADSKSLKSLSDSSPRGSRTSLVSSDSVNSNLNNYGASEDMTESGGDRTPTEEDTWVVWGDIVNDWEEFTKRKPKFLKNLVRRGIPHHFRGIAWQLLCNAHQSPLKEEYAEYLKATSPCEKVIRRDIARTYPEHEFFREKDGLGQETLFNVMKAYSLHDREVGYCQGSGFIVGLLLMQMPEEETFCVLVHLMQDYRLRELFKPSMAELGLCMFQLECMVQELLPDLHIHFQTQCFHTSMYASSWFLTLFATVFPLQVACRVMDLFMSEGMEIVFRLGIALLQASKSDLMQLDMEGMLKYFQKEIPLMMQKDPESIFNLAYNIKYNQKKMKKLEKEYMSLKSKELEEQIEIRRLRNENQLLRQRIEILEKESAALADKLIQGQVVRAQEQEENFIMMRELAAVRQHSFETMAALEDARDVIKTLTSDGQKPVASSSHSLLLDEAVSKLQQELAQAKLQEAEAKAELADLKDKCQESLHKENQTSNVCVEALQEELVQVKLREAEGQLSLKALTQTVFDLEEHCQKHLARTTGSAARSSNRKGDTKQVVEVLQDELMSVKLREADVVAALKESRLRVMELETMNNSSTSHLKRAEASVEQLTNKLEAAEKHSAQLQSELNHCRKQLSELKAKSTSEVMDIRLREADKMATIAELRQRVADLEIQHQERLTANQLGQDNRPVSALNIQSKIDKMEKEVKRLRSIAKLLIPGSRSAGDGGTDSPPGEVYITMELQAEDVIILDDDSDTDNTHPGTATPTHTQQQDHQLSTMASSIIQEASAENCNSEIVTNQTSPQESATFNEKQRDNTTKPMDIMDSNSNMVDSTDRR
ncbi:EVI5-like protein isoform X2 [Branchiostoma floridae]|uniref:EVI5-like protein isoform X2 n=1 Tax=Branchiostoma floridae TaxID=7739 RepID=A0A9J7LKD5_BRAFL|nr:EVI5-like protein isoform X2 [Branchiostoma floridae]